MRTNSCLGPDTTQREKTEKEKKRKPVRTETESKQKANTQRLDMNARKSHDIASSVVFALAAGKVMIPLPSTWPLEAGSSDIPEA